MYLYMYIYRARASTANSIHNQERTEKSEHLWRSVVEPYDEHSTVLIRPHNLVTVAGAFGIFACILPKAQCVPHI